MAAPLQLAPPPRQPAAPPSHPFPQPATEQRRGFTQLDIRAVSDDIDEIPEDIDLDDLEQVGTLRDYDMKCLGGDSEQVSHFKATDADREEIEPVLCMRISGKGFYGAYLLELEEGVDLSRFCYTSLETDLGDWLDCVVYRLKNDELVFMNKVPVESEGEFHQLDTHLGWKLVSEEWSRSPKSDWDEIRKDVKLGYFDEEE